jgi:hypothetical protein
MAKRKIQLLKCDGPQINELKGHLGDGLKSCIELPRCAKRSRNERKVERARRPRLKLFLLLDWPLDELALMGMAAEDREPHSSSLSVLFKLNV